MNEWASEQLDERSLHYLWIEGRERSKISDKRQEETSCVHVRARVKCTLLVARRWTEGARQQPGPHVPRRQPAVFFPAAADLYTDIHGFAVEISVSYCILL